MTVPQERFRALRWARAWLEGVALDPLVPPHAKSEAVALLAAYPSDAFIRTMIGRQTDLPKHSLEALGAASRWLSTFRHPTSNPDALHAALRHMPTPDDVAFRIYMHDRRASHQVLQLVGDWLEPDLDYIDAVVMGWHVDCALAVGAEWLDASDRKIEDADPLYLISARTHGVEYRDLKLGQRVRCTVARRWDDNTRTWRHVTSCELSQAAPPADPTSASRSGPCA